MFHLTIPTKNEAPYITDTIRRLSKSLADLSIPWQIIVADNGSTDQTEQTIEDLIRTSYVVHRTKKSVEPVDSTKYEVRGTNLVYLECPKVGKGAAIRHVANQLVTAPSSKGDIEQGSIGGFPTSESKYEIRNTKFDDQLLKVDLSESKFQVPGSKFQGLFGFIDADLSADPDAIPAMVNRILENQADIVIASRLLVTKTTNRSWLRTLSSKLFNFFADLALNLKVQDAQCGLKIMNEKGLEILKSCKEDGWFLDIEFLAKARQDKLRIVEIPVPWIEFRYPERKSQIRHLKDGLGAFRAIRRIKKNIRKSYDVHRTNHD
jgi:glycosyltransferase involved in cell wall biosynthesis